MNTADDLDDGISEALSDAISDGDGRPRRDALQYYLERRGLLIVRALPADSASDGEDKDDKNPTESVADASCRTQGSASTADQSDTAHGRHNPASGEGADAVNIMDLSQAGAAIRIRDAEIAVLQNDLTQRAKLVANYAIQIAALREELSIWKSVFPDIAPESVLPDRSKLEAEIVTLRAALERMVAEFEKMTRYGSPMAKAANENLQFAKGVLASIKQVEDGAL